MNVYRILLASILFFYQAVPTVAGGYHPSGGYIAANFLGAIIGRIYTLEVLGFVMPKRPGSECRLNEIKSMSSIEALQENTKYIPGNVRQKCLMTRIVSIKENEFQLAYPNIIPCDQIQNKLHEIIIYQRFGLITVPPENYDNLGIIGIGSSSIMLGGQLDYSYPSERDFFIKSIAQIKSWTIEQHQGYCSIFVQMNKSNN